MKNAGISELRDSLSESLARIRKGETVIVDDRDAPIARIEPIFVDLDDRLRDAARREGFPVPPA